MLSAAAPAEKPAKISTRIMDSSDSGPEVTLDRRAGV
jgi:hypothetical protein